MATEDTLLLQINSALRNPLIGSDTDANFGFSIPDGVIRRVPKRVKVFSAVIPYSWNFVVSTNNKFNFTVGVNTYNIVIPSQNYSAITLASQIQGAMNTVVPIPGVIFSVVLDGVTNKLTISATGPFDLDFDVTDTIGNILGYGANVYTGNFIYVAGNIMNLVFDTYIDISSNIVSGKDNGIIIVGATDVAKPPVLSSIPICADYGGIVFYQAPDDLQPINIENSKFSTSIRARKFPVILDFQLTTPSGINIDMNGVGWSMILQFFYN